MNYDGLIEIIKKSHFICNDSYGNYIYNNDNNYYIRSSDRNDPFIIDYDNKVAFYGKNIKYNIDFELYKKDGLVCGKGNSIEKTETRTLFNSGYFENGKLIGTFNQDVYDLCNPDKLIYRSVIKLDSNGKVIYASDKFNDNRTINGSVKNNKFDGDIEYCLPSGKKYILNAKNGNIIDKEKSNKNIIEIDTIERKSIINNANSVLQYNISCHGSYSKMNNKSSFLDSYSDSIFKKDGKNISYTSDLILNIFEEIKKNKNNKYKTLKINLLSCKQDLSGDELKKIIQEAPKNIDIQIEMSGKDNNIFAHFTVDGSPINTELENTKQINIYKIKYKNNDSKQMDLIKQELEKKHTNKGITILSHNNRSYSIESVSFDAKISHVFKVQNTFIERFKKHVKKVHKAVNGNNKVHPVSQKTRSI